MLTWPHSWTNMWLGVIAIGTVVAVNLLRAIRNDLRALRAERLPDDAAP